jgi:hypothetical protein
MTMSALAAAAASNTTGRQLRIMFTGSGPCSGTGQRRHPLPRCGLGPGHDPGFLHPEGSAPG